MIRTLAMIAIAGFFVAVSGAAALGGYDVKKHGGWSFPVQWDWDDDDNNGSDGRRIDWNTPETTRSIEWAGADRIEIGIPADVTFTQAATPVWWSPARATPSNMSWSKAAASASRAGARFASISEAWTSTSAAWKASSA
jgi:hypothetical protein